MSSKSPKYAENVSAVVLEQDAFYRLEGELVRRAGDRFELCDQNQCVTCVFLTPSIERFVSKRVIVEGQWHENQLVVTEILSRCSHSPH